MTIELWMLFWSVVLTFVLILIDVGGTALQVSLAQLAGNREDMPAKTGWMHRANKSYKNALETVPLFAGLVLIAHVAGINGDLTSIGAQLFFWGRLAHAVVFQIGIPWLRTGVWLVAVAGMVLIGIAILIGPAAA